MDGLVLTTNQKSLAADLKPDIWDDPNAEITIDPESDMGLALQQGLDQIAAGQFIEITDIQSHLDGVLAKVIRASKESN
ncbi:MAG: hypothetical protein QM523_07525 [Candidatus Pacebacteria bacterium]|nr:hypothetical protein [Candidatus Paceibacterota bacterium]